MYVLEATRTKNQTYNIIKLDVQGSELDILKGGMIFMEKADFILSECSLVEYNVGGPSFDEQLEFFNNNNFNFVDIIDLLYNCGPESIEIILSGNINKISMDKVYYE